MNMLDVSEAKTLSFSSLFFLFYQGSEGGGGF